MLLSFQVKMEGQNSTKLWYLSLCLQWWLAGSEVCVCSGDWLDLTSSTNKSLHLLLFSVPRGTGFLPGKSQLVRNRTLRHVLNYSLSEMGSWVMWLCRAALTGLQCMLWWLWRKKCVMSSSEPLHANLVAPIAGQISHGRNQWLRLTFFSWACQEVLKPRKGG